jgi:hypothetical protein
VVVEPVAIGDAVVSHFLSDGEEFNTSLYFSLFANTNVTSPSSDTKAIQALKFISEKTFLITYIREIIESVMGHIP